MNEKVVSLKLFDTTIHSDDYKESVDVSFYTHHLQIELTELDVENQSESFLQDYVTLNKTQAYELKDKLDQWLRGDL